MQFCSIIITDQKRYITAATHYVGKVTDQFHAHQVLTPHEAVGAEPPKAQDLDIISQY